MIALIESGSFVIDLDTGTILGPNLVAVNPKNLDEVILDNIENGFFTDDEIISLGEEFGNTLWVD